MRTPVVIAIVVALHCVVIGSVVLIQGCGTPRGPKPSQQPPPMPPPVVAPQPPPIVTPPLVTTKTYTVKKGDCLSGIAQRFKVSSKEIAKLNNLTDVGKLRVGQKLQLPGYVDLNAPEPPRKPKPEPKPSDKIQMSLETPTTGGEVYVVKAGDSLSAIAAKFGTKASAIREANQIKSDKIIVGQKLMIPGSGATAPSPQVPEEKKSETEIQTEIPEPGLTAPSAVPPAVEPAVTDAAPKSATAPGLSPTEGTAAKIHTVREGEDVYSIAREYGVLSKEIMNLNSLTNTTVAPGQKLKIP